VNEQIMSLLPQATFTVIMDNIMGTAMMSGDVT